VVHATPFIPAVCPSADAIRDEKQRPFLGSAFGSRIRIAHSYVHASRGACFSSRLQSRLRMYRMQQIANASLPT
jgi:hypothetical protein